MTKTMANFRMIINYESNLMCSSVGFTILKNSTSNKYYAEVQKRGNYHYYPVFVQAKNIIIYTLKEAGCADRFPDGLPIEPPMMEEEKTSQWVDDPLALPPFMGIGEPQAHTSIRLKKENSELLEIWSRNLSEFSELNSMRETHLVLARAAQNDANRRVFLNHGAILQRVYEDMIATMDPALAITTAEMMKKMMEEAPAVVP